MEHQEMLRLKLAGLSYREIGKRAGISGQRVHKILNPPSAISRYVRHRAGYRCERCLLDIGKSGHVHHKMSDGKEGENYQDINNLEYLCLSCHMKEHAWLTNFKNPPKHR